MNFGIRSTMGRWGASVCAVMIMSFAGGVQAADLTSLLMNQIGVTKPQAEGGAGSIFKYAKSQMTAENFAKVKQAVPGMSKYLKAAPNVSTAVAAPSTLTAGAAAAGVDTGGLMSGATNMLNANGLGGVADKLGAAQALAPAFEKLGLKPETVSRFLPVVVDYVKSSGGNSVASLLTGALGM
jgi:hypothetical protein